MKINTANKKLTVWIAKVPKYLGEKIMGCRGETTIGTLSIDRAPENAGAVVRVCLSDAFQKMNIPVDHLIDIKEREQRMYIVSSGGDQMVVEGHVNKECFIRPVINERYLEHKRRLQASQNRGETATKIIDYFTEVRKGEKYGSLKEIDILARKRKIMLQEKKRERLDSQDVYDMIFNAYEQRELWTVKDLADFTGQPVAYIQELVAEVCVLNKKDHKNSYELKPEYKNN